MQNEQNNQKHGSNPCRTATFPEKYSEEASSSKDLANKGAKACTFTRSPDRAERESLHFGQDQRGAREVDGLAKHL